MLLILQLFVSCGGGVIVIIFKRAVLNDTDGGSHFTHPVYVMDVAVGNEQWWRRAGAPSLSTWRISFYF